MSSKANTTFSYRLSTDTIAALLGLSSHDLPAVADWVAAFVRCLTPRSDATQLAAGKERQ